MSCETWCKRTAAAAAVAACAVWLTVAPAAAQPPHGSEPAPTPAPAATPSATAAEQAPAAATEPGPSQPAQPEHAQPEHAQPGTADHGTPAGDHAAAAADHGAAAEHGGGHDESPWPFIGKIFNFTILVGTLVYFLRKPFAQYLADRGQQVRQDLVTARATKEEAARQLAAIDARMKALPGELESLRARGREEVAAEEARIREAAAGERDRLLEQTQREVDLQLRVARRDLVALAADLSVQVARDRIRDRITDADQLRLVDRYLAQVRTHE